MRITGFNNKKTTRKIYINDRLALLLMAIPFIALVFAFSYVPLFGWIYAFFDYTPGIPLYRSEFTGLKSLIKLLTDRDLLEVIVNTLALSFLGLLCSPVPVIFAILLNEIKNRPFKKIVQTITTLPNFISWVIIFSLSFFMFSSEGVLNQLLDKMKLIERPLNILGNEKIVWFFQTALGLWKGTGWGAIIYLAAIAGIDSELFDSARIDGAGRFRVIMHITVPCIIPTYLVLLLLSISNLLSVGFEQYLVFYNGLVADKITVLDLYVYRLGLLISDYSYATAVGIFKTVVSIILLFTVNEISRRLRGDSLI